MSNLSILITKKDLDEISKRIENDVVEVIVPLKKSEKIEGFEINQKELIK